MQGAWECLFEWVKLSLFFLSSLFCEGNRRVRGPAGEGVCRSESSTRSSQDPPPPCWTGWAEPARLRIRSRGFCTEGERQLRGCGWLSAGSRSPSGEKEGYTHRYPRRGFLLSASYSLRHRHRPSTPNCEFVFKHDAILLNNIFLKQNNPALSV